MGRVLAMADYDHLKRPKYPSPLALSLDLARQWFLIGLASMALIAAIVRHGER